MKKILTIVYMLHKGGTERVAQNFAEAYQTLGHDSRVMVTEELGVRAAELKLLGIKVYEYCSEHLEQIKQWSPEIIHIHSLGMNVEKLDKFFYCIPAGFKVVESNVFSTPVPYEQYLDISLQLSKWCDWKYGKKKHYCKSLILPNPVNTTNFYRSEQEKIDLFRNLYGILPTDIVLGRIGQCFLGKWSSQLVELFCHLCKKYENLKLLLVNPSESVCGQIAQQPAVIRAKIVIIQQIIGDDCLRDCYSSIDVFVHVADQGESFGLVLAEAMLCKVPIVTYSTPWGDNSQGEIVGNGIGGFVVTNFRDLTRAVDALIHDVELRKRFGEAGRTRVVDRYDSILVANQLISSLSDNIVASSTSNATIARAYSDVYGRFSKLVFLLLLISPNGFMFDFFRYLILCVAKYGPFFPVNPKFIRSISAVLFNTFMRTDGKH